MAARGGDHMDELGLVGGRHHHHVGQAAEIGDVEGARMGRPVGADQPGAVEREAHRQLLDRHVMDDLVVGALQEGRVDRAERLVALAGEARREGHRMLLGDADIEGAARMGLAEGVEPGARRHGGRDRDDALCRWRASLISALAKTPV
jgi:hypothetical protein